MARQLSRPHLPHLGRPETGIISPLALFGSDILVLHVRIFTFLLRELKYDSHSMNMTAQHEPRQRDAIAETPLSVYSQYSNLGSIGHDIEDYEYNAGVIDLPYASEIDPMIECMEDPT